MDKMEHAWELLASYFRKGVNPHCGRSLVHLYVVGEDFGKRFWE